MTTTDEEPRLEDVALDAIRKSLDSLTYASPEQRPVHAARAVEGLNLVLHEIGLHATLGRKST